MKKRIGRKFKFSADNFQMPFETPDNPSPGVGGTWQYRAEVLGIGPKFARLRLASPRFAAGKVIRMSLDQLREALG